MKKITGKIIKALLGLIILVLVLLFTIPVLFKEKIKTKVESVINESVNARVTFADYKLSFFRNFPNLSFSMKDLYVVGVAKFEGDTLAGFRSFDLVFNLSSLLGSSGYEIRSIIIDKGIVNVIYLKDGSANYDIAKPSADTATGAETSSTGSPMKILLRKVAMKNSAISYSDESMNLAATISNLDFLLSGDMTGSTTDLDMILKSGATTVTMDGVKYLNKAVIDSKVTLKANLDSMKFIFGDNFMDINDLRLKFTGMVAMPGDDIATDLKFAAENTSFKTLLSLVPAVFMEGYENLTATGDFSLSGEAKGVYSDADSSMPDISLKMSVNNGLVSYPDLPEKISNINITSDVFVDGKDLDKTTVNVGKFHFELAGNPFDMSFYLKTPMSDPDFSGAANGKIDLAALTKAVPLDSISLSGVIEMAITMAGRMSYIEKEQYEKFSAKGTLSIKNMSVKMTGYPGVDIREASFLFTPAFAQMKKADLIVEGKSDFVVSGNLENYIPYLFKNETIKGALAMNSKMVDVSSIMGAMSSDTSVVAEDTTSLAVIAVPKNINFDFNAAIERFSYDNIKADNVKGHVIVKDGVLSIRKTGMNILGGAMMMNADYDTRDTLKPVMKADFEMKNIEVKDAFNTFVTLQKFAPTAKGLAGKVNVNLAYESLLGSDMMPVITTINGAGKIQSDQIQLLESATFDKFKEFLKLGDKYSNTFKDINVSFTIKEGRVYVSPFNVKTGNIKMNISGDQGLDQTINYLIKTEIPRSDLGSSVNSLIDNLSTQAAAFGITYKPADILKVNVRVKGTFTKPVVGPDFSGPAAKDAGAAGSTKEIVKQVYNNSVDQTKDKLREEAALQGDKLIKEAEEKGQQLRDEAAKAALRMRQEADSSGAKLIKNAEPKGMLAKAGAQKGSETLKKEAEKRGNQLILEADNQAKKLVEEAKLKKEEMIKKI
jgi:predicted ester cyclase